MPQTPNYSRIDHRSASTSSHHHSPDGNISDTSVDDLDPLRRPTYFQNSDTDYGDTSDDDETAEEDDNHSEKNGTLALRLPKHRGSKKFKAYHHRRNSSLQVAATVSKRLSKRFARWLTPPKLCAIFSLVLLIVLLSVFGGISRSWVPKPLRKSYTVDGQSPPWYPSPLGGTMKRWEESYIKAANLVEKMSLVEKVNITTGTGWEMGLCVGNTAPAMHVGFPSLCLQDGPLGLRFVDNITASPAGITVGATWNKELMYKRGRMLGLESRSKGVNVLLGPSVGPLGRSPAGGRNWEAFGIDPVLQGLAAAETIRGIQEEGVMATIKHFVGNEQEHFRQAWEWGLPNAMSSNIDDRTLHEIYAWPFADSVRAGVASVMCAYQMVNNSYACQNSKLINGILKDELGFQGFVQSDWLAQRSGVASALSGLDMSMPGDGEHWANGQPFWGPHLTRAVLNGTVPIDRLNDMVTRIVAAWYQVGQDNATYWPPAPPNGTEGGPNFSSWTNDRTGLLYPGSDSLDSGVVNQWVDAAATGTYSHAALARRIAAEGVVLLKNVDRMLPLARSGWSQEEETSSKPYSSGTRRHVAVFGEDSRLDSDGPNVCADRGCNRGTLASGWGSGAVDFPYLVAPLDALRDAFHEDIVNFTSFPTNDPVSNLTSIEEQDLCIVFVNADSGEGFIASDGIEGDRNDLYLQKGGEELIAEVSAHCGLRKKLQSSQSVINNREPHQGYGNTIVVVHAVGPVIMESFITNSSIGAVLLANLPGQESGNALVDVLFGLVNPSGHLPYTIARRPSDYGPAGKIIYQQSPEEDVPQSNFTEGILVDYRWFDSKRLVPRFEFGYGLSYTKFSLADLRILATSPPNSGPLPRPDDECDPPIYDSKIPDPKEALFPAGFRRLKKFIYPYIDSLKDAKPKEDYPYPEIFGMSPLSEAGGGEGGNPSLFEPLVQIEVEVQNEGERGGQAVVQLYVVFPSGVSEEMDVLDIPLDNREEPTVSQNITAALVSERPSTFRRANVPVLFPPRVLRGFEKIHLRGSYQPPSQTFTAHPHVHTPHYPLAYSTAVAPGPAAEPDRFDQPGSDGKGGIFYASGENARLRFVLTRRDLSYWSTTQQNWVLPRGAFGIELGFSSRDILLRGSVFT